MWVNNGGVSYMAILLVIIIILLAIAIFLLYHLSINTATIVRQQSKHEAYNNEDIYSKLNELLETLREIGGTLRKIHLEQI